MDAIDYNRKPWETVDELPSSEMTERIIGCAYAVSNTLGVGFLEKVYENALAHELRKAGFSVVQKKPIRVIYDGVDVGIFETDLIVNDQIIIEVKAVKALIDAHKGQCINYLKATGIRLALLINFGTPRIDVRRVAL